MMMPPVQMPYRMVNQPQPINGQLFNKGLPMMARPPMVNQPVINQPIRPPPQNLAFLQNPMKPMAPQQMPKQKPKQLFSSSQDIL